MSLGMILTAAQTAAGAAPTIKKGLFGGVNWGAYNDAYNRIRALGGVDMSQLGDMDQIQNTSGMSMISSADIDNMNLGNKGLFHDPITKRKQRLQAELDSQKQFFGQSMANRALDINSRTFQQGLGTSFQYGGALGTFFPNVITRVDAGGSHEENPLGGVPMGVNPATGEPNLVEEGEAVYSVNGSPYVLSDSIELPKELKKKYRLSGKTFADAIRAAADELEKRPLDKIANDSFKEKAEMLVASQEQIRQDMASKDNKRKNGGLLNGNLFPLGGPINTGSTFFDAFMRNQLNVNNGGYMLDQVDIYPEEYNAGTTGTVYVDGKRPEASAYALNRHRGNAAMLQTLTGVSPEEPAQKSNELSPTKRAPQVDTTTYETPRAASYPAFVSNPTDLDRTAFDPFRGVYMEDNEVNQLEPNPYVMYDTGAPKEAAPTAPATPKAAASAPRTKSAGNPLPKGYIEGITPTVNPNSVFNPASNDSMPHMITREPIQASIQELPMEIGGITPSTKASDDGGGDEGEGGSGPKFNVNPLTYAPAIASGIAVLGDLLGHNKPERMATPKMGPLVGYNPVGTKLAFNPNDVAASMNDLRQMGAGNMRAVMNGNNNAATAVALNHSLGMNAGKAQGMIYDSNRDRQQQIAQYNNTIDQQNAASSMQASAQNAQLFSNYMAQLMNIEAYNAAQRQAAAQAKQTNLDNLFGNLGNIGQTLTALDWTKKLVQSGALNGYNK